MSSNITLSSASRQSLSSLQDTASLLQLTQNRLATGKKVNAALDNPTSFFTASNLNSRATGLSSLMDGMSNGVQTIQAANKGLESISKSLDSLKGLINQVNSSASSTTKATGTTGTLTASSAFAGASGDKLTIANSTDGSTTAVDISGATTIQGVMDAVNSGTNGNYNASIVDGSLSITAGSSTTGDTYTASVTNAGTLSGTKTTALFNQATAVSSTTTSNLSQSQLTSYAKQINSLLDTVAKTASDSGFNGTNLLSGSSLTMKYNKEGTSTSTVDGQDMSLSGLGMSKFANASTATLSQITAMSDKIDKASDSVSSYQGSLATGLSVVQNRQDFTRSMVNILNTGADALVNADMTEEGANLLALQSRQSISTSALSLAYQAQQSVLQLLR